MKNRHGHSLTTELLVSLLTPSGTSRIDRLLQEAQRSPEGNQQSEVPVGIRALDRTFATMPAHFPVMTGERTFAESRDVACSTCRANGLDCDPDCALHPDRKPQPAKSKRKASPATGPASGEGGQR